LGLPEDAEFEDLGVLHHKKNHRLLGDVDGNEWEVTFDDNGNILKKTLVKEKSSPAVPVGSQFEFDFDEKPIRLRPKVDMSTWKRK
jgi:hypothetical protein